MLLRVVTVRLHPCMWNLSSYGARKVSDVLCLFSWGQPAMHFSVCRHFPSVPSSNASRVAACRLLGLPMKKLQWSEWFLQRGGVSLVLQVFQGAPLHVSFLLSFPSPFNLVFVHVACHGGPCRRERTLAVSFTFAMSHCVFQSRDQKSGVMSCQHFVSLAGRTAYWCWICYPPLLLVSILRVCCECDGRYVLGRPSGGMDWRRAFLWTVGGTRAYSCSSLLLGGSGLSRCSCKTGLSQTRTCKKKRTKRDNKEV